MLSLYPLSQKVQDILARVESCEEIGDELLLWLESFEDSLPAVVDEVDGLLKTLKMEAAQAREEAEGWRKKYQSREKVIETTRATLLGIMQKIDQPVIRGAKRTARIQLNSAVPLDLDQVDPSTVDAKFRTVTVTLNKEAIRAHLDEGGELPFARLGNRGVHLRIT